MSALAKPQARGACPGLSAPMPTGDGLLMRFLPIGTISLSAMSGLCATARAHGSGIIEITSRGSVQLRGLSDYSAPQCAADLASLGIAAEDGVPIHNSPLAGLDATDLVDTGAIAAELRVALARQSLAALSPKVSIVIDGGGALSLNDLAADVRLCAQASDGRIVFRVGVAGDKLTAVGLGTVLATDAVTTVVRLLDVIAGRGKAVRARDIDAVVFHASIAELLISGDPELGSYLRGNERNDAPAIGRHLLKDRSLACGVSLAFGHTDADRLEQLIDAAGAAGARGVRAAPGRVLLAIGLRSEAASAFVATAERLGFIVRPNDPRRRLIACAGAPICASAYVGSRMLAPGIAEEIAGGDLTVHLSGCAKGCARAAPADLTIVGTPDGCALIADGSVRDKPFAIVATDALPKAIADYARSRTYEAAHV